MSADNEIAIINFKNKIAVGEVRGCPTESTILNYIAKDGPTFVEDFRLFEYGDSEPASDYAINLLDSYSFVEYGINEYQVDKTVEEFLGGPIPVPKMVKYETVVKDDLGRLSVKMAFTVKDGTLVIETDDFDTSPPVPSTHIQAVSFLAHKLEEAEEDMRKAMRFKEALEKFVAAAAETTKLKVS